MHVPLKSWANGFRIKATPEDRFTGRVCEKKKIILKWHWASMFVIILTTFWAWYKKFNLKINWSLIDGNFLLFPGAMPSMTKTMEPRVTSADRKPSTPKRSAGPDVAGVTKGSSVAPASRSATAKTPGRPSRTRTGVVQFAGTNARFTPAQKRELIPIKSFSEFGTKGTWYASRSRRIPPICRKARVFFNVLFSCVRNYCVQ